jgi:hypothetical protein
MKNKILFSKILILWIFSVTLPQYSFAQEKNIDSKTLDEFCKSAQEDSINILAKLYIKIGPNRTESEIEIYREVYAEAMREEINRLNDKANKDKSLARVINLIVTVTEKNYKYALCEKLKRPKASPVTIANESYMYCRKSILENRDDRPLPCF